MRHKIILTFLILGLITIIIGENVYSQSELTIDTNKIILKIKEQYKIITENKNNYQVEKQGTIDFDKTVSGYEDQWYGEEVKRYYKDSLLVLKVLHSRGGSYQMGETKNYKEYYIDNGNIFFYYERLITISSSQNPDYPSYGFEKRIYYYNGKPIKYLRKDIDLTGLIEMWPHKENYDNVIEQLKMIKNKIIDLSDKPDLPNIKTEIY